ncbi:MAG TPA: GTPase [Pirellulales bacterium]|nr:GTPase [Pirellulales bacterium]
MIGVCRAVVLTPAGRGAVATVLVEGPAAARLVGRFFASASGKPLERHRLGSIAFGRWHSAAGEELVVSRRSVEQVEIHCHGGQAAVAAVLEALETAGCTAQPWTEWIAERGGDRIQSQAVEALSRAATDRTAAILLDQFNGALAAAIEAMLRLLARSDAASLAAAQAALNALQANIAVGRHLMAPFSVVLAGRPNVGKSSLINAIVGYRRSIVFDQPGTTRDVVTAATALDGWPVELADTAGLRVGEDLLEQEGVSRAEMSLAAADLRVLVFDRSRAWSAEDQELHEAWPDAVVVHHKADLPAVGRPARPPGISTSVLTSTGVDALIGAVVARLAPAPPAPGSAVPFDESHFQAILLAAESLARGESAGAALALQSLL